MKKIEFSDISVVVQGAVGKDTRETCLSIRKHLPNSHIILSTWEESNVDNLDYDVLVLSQDPGGISKYCMSDEKKLNNINRQIVSTQAGLKKVNTKYTLKLRSDTILIGSDFINYFDLFQIRDLNFSHAKHRIIVPSHFSRIVLCEINIQTPFHPSVWYFFGLTDDIKSYFLNTPLVSEPNFSMFFKDNDIIQMLSGYQYLWQYPPEQYFCVSYFKQFLDIKFESLLDYNEENILLSKKLLANNFIFLDFEQSKILNKKYNDRTQLQDKLITYYEFLKLYRQYCDPNYKIPFKYFLQNNNELKTYKAEIKKHTKTFLWNPFTKWLLRPFAVVYYSSKLILSFIKFLFLK